MGEVLSSDNSHRCWRITAVIAIISGAYSLPACGTGDFVVPTADPSSVMVTTVGVDGCAHKTPAVSQTGDEKELASAISMLSFPAGVCLFLVDLNNSIDAPGRVSITISLDAAGSSGPDDLRPVATDIAQLIKTTEIGSRTAILDVTNRGAAASKYRQLLTDEEFLQHRWDGTPSEEADCSIWKVVDPG